MQYVSIFYQTKQGENELTKQEESEMEGLLPTILRTEYGDEYSHRFSVKCPNCKKPHKVFLQLTTIVHQKKLTKKQIQEMYRH